MKKSFSIFVIGFIGLVLSSSLLAAPASATTKEQDFLPDVGEEFSFSVMLPNNYKVGEEVPLQALEARNVDLQVLSEEVSEQNLTPKALSSVDSQSPLAAAKALNTTYDVLLNFTDRSGRAATIRRGHYTKGKGFGYWKLADAHNVSMLAAKTGMKYAPTRKLVGGTTYNYDHPVQLITCKWYGCYVEKSVTLRVGHDFRKLSDGKPMGVITGFCIGSTKCPDWVNKAVNT